MYMYSHTKLISEMRKNICCGCLKLFVVSFLFPIIVVFLVAKISNIGRTIIITFHNILFHHQFHPVLSKLDVLYLYTPSGGRPHWHFPQATIITFPSFPINLDQLCY